ncbi:RluA family pseudouridine synthase [Parabacteroides sp. 52]|uniref:RluA family pseudouridine synthase n=1 Tax=Parabacteroides sp. 52 TaxID=2302940 RepID=UPI0013D2D956|nr:RluA family pseudouridine synthase [Parabacteroides sp. 52]NDV55653.1 RluA family pseudouridine synthase [Parabacteroides sp. 52]
MKRNNTKRRYNPQRAQRGRKVTVKESNTLLPFLFQTLNDQSKSSVKAILAHGQISVNGKVTTQFDTPLTPNDVVGISYERGKVAFNHPLLKIVWEDNYLVLVNKKEGLLSVGTEKEKERTAYNLLINYVKKTDPRNKIFILHRLDKETSGLMLFAKNRGIQETLQADWGRLVTEQSYITVVEGRPERETDLLTSTLTNETDTRVIIAAEGDGAEAIARYKLKRSNGEYSLLEVHLESGRRNHIRMQLGRIGHPVAGDRKNGAESNPAGRLMLHAQKFSFIHPETKVEMCFDTQIPAAFTSLTK